MHESRLVNREGVSPGQLKEESSGVGIRAEKSLLAGVKVTKRAPQLPGVHELAIAWPNEGSLL